MASQRTTVLEPTRLNDTDEIILDELQEGRVTPTLVAERHDLGRSYVSQRLIRLREHGHAEAVTKGLYELVEDPREVER